MWDCFANIPEAATMDYWQRIRYLASSAGFGDGAVDEVFKEEVRKVVNNGDRDRHKTDPKYLGKRLCDSEDENRQLRAKVAKLELQAADNSISEDSESTVSDSSTSSEPPTPPPTDIVVTPQAKLEALVGKLKARNKEDGFPMLCAGALKELSRLIDAGATKELTFCIKLSSGTGKSLLKILILASLHRKGALTAGKGSSLNWLSFVDG
jgi:hypothetical protein